jgi:hypothetical protein
VIDLDQVTGLLPRDAWLLLAVVVPAVLLAALVVVLTRRRPAPSIERDLRRADRLTVVVAGLVTGASAQGIWTFLGDVLDLHPVLRMLFFAVIELSLFTSALRARITLRLTAELAHVDPTVRMTTGVDGIAVWVLAGLSAVLSALDAGSLPLVAWRLAMPLLAAWLWERGLAAERRQATGTAGRIHWRLTPERILVALRLAEPTGRAASEVDRARRLADLGRAAYRLHTLRALRAGRWWRQRHAAWRLRRHVLGAAEHLALADDAAVRQSVRGHLAVLYGVMEGTAPAAVADLNPWTPARSLVDTGPDIERPDDTDGEGPDNADTDQEAPSNSAGGMGSGVQHSPTEAALIARAVAAYQPDMGPDMIARLVGRSERSVKRYLLNGTSSEVS